MKNLHIKQLNRRPILSRIWFAFLAIILTGCNSANIQTSTVNVVDKAGAEATALIQNAQATAIMVKAQAQATSVMQTAIAPAVTNTPSLEPTTQSTAVGLTVTPSVLSSSQVKTSPTVAITTVSLLGVHMGGDGGFIAVEFDAPLIMVNKWHDGAVYVIDEATGITYNVIPNMPVVGPLFAKPKAPGGMGYVMFYNAKNAVKVGSVLTVVLGDFKQEHVPVK